MSVNWAVSVVSEIFSIRDFFHADGRTGLLAAIMAHADVSFPSTGPLSSASIGLCGVEATPNYSAE